MYRILSVKDVVRVPPKKFGRHLETTILSEFENRAAAGVDRNIGIVLAAIDVKETGEGRIIMGDGAIYYDAVLDILTYQPKLDEVVEGEVTEITEFGAFIHFGPIDGLVHVSQITEDFMTYDQKNAVLAGKESKKILKQGDRVRARIVSVSLKSRLSDCKIGLTMRQAYLGKIEWLDEEKKLQQKKSEPEVKGAKAKEKGGKTKK